MKATSFLVVLFCCFLCLEAPALSFPATASVVPVFEDSTAKAVSVVPAQSAPRKMPSFFERPEKRTAGTFIKISSATPDQSGIKSILGWLAPGVTGLGIALLFFDAGAIVGILILGGILTGIVTLFVPKSKEGGAANKR